MKLSLDCEFMQLNYDTNQISLALVSEVGREYYVELTDTCLVGEQSELPMGNES